jgi:chromosome segregation and condensation protein ScpB
VVGRNCNLDLIIEDVRAGLAGRVYELASVAGGWQHRAKRACADVIRGAFGAAAGQGAEGSKELSQSEALVLMRFANFQPFTRGELSPFFGKEVSRDLIGVLRAQGLIASGPRSPQPGAPYTYVTTKRTVSEDAQKSFGTEIDRRKRIVSTSESARARPLPAPACRHSRMPRKPCRFCAHVRSRSMPPQPPWPRWNNRAIRQR